MRNIGVVLILVLIGITIVVVSSQTDSVLVSHAQLTNKDQSGDTGFLTRSVIAKEPDLVVNDDSTEQIDNIDPIPPSEPSEVSVPEDKQISRIDKEDKNKDESQAAYEFERLIIPTLKVNGKVLSKPYAELSWDLTTLGQDIAILENIPEQTSGNNIIFAGHITVRNGSNGPFRYLWKINPGEKIILHDDQYAYTYIVREQVLVYPEDSSVLADTSHPQLTLITCHTWDEETLSYLRRLVVFADLESIEARQVSVD